LSFAILAISRAWIRQSLCFIGLTPVASIQCISNYRLPFLLSCLKAILCIEYFIWGRVSLNRTQLDMLRLSNVRETLSFALLLNVRHNYVYFAWWKNCGNG
jgi:hypothetical protein